MSTKTNSPNHTRIRSPGPRLAYTHWKTVGKYPDTRPRWQFGDVESSKTQSSYKRIILDRKRGWVYSNIAFVQYDLQMPNILWNIKTGAWYFQQKVQGEEADQTLRDAEASLPNGHLFCLPIIEHEISGIVCRLVPATGVAISLSKLDPDTGKWLVDIGEGNRLVLTDEEKEEIGSYQPYTLPNQALLKHDGTKWDPVVVGRIIYETKYALRWKGNKENRGNKLNVDEIPKITDEEALAVVMKAREYGVRFERRHFKMVWWREGIKLGKDGDTSLWVAVLRVLSEECGRVPKDGHLTTPLQYTHAYIRPGGKSCVLCYNLNVDDTQIDVNTLRKKGFCNWYSPMKCPKICDNDLFETRNHRFVTEDEAWRELSEFEETYSALGCDFSKNGACDMFSSLRVKRPLSDQGVRRLDNDQTHRHTRDA